MKVVHRHSQIRVDAFRLDKKGSKRLNGQVYAWNPGDWLVLHPERPQVLSDGEFHILYDAHVPASAR